MSKDRKKCDPKTKKVSSIPTGTKTPLMKAARDGDTKRVHTLIKNGPTSMLLMKTSQQH